MWSTYVQHKQNYQKQWQRHTVTTACDGREAARHHPQSVMSVPSNTYYYATSPGMLRLRGALWCLPRLLAWKWRAVLKANAPDEPGGKRWRAEYALYVRRSVPVPSPKRRRIECGLYQERQWPITMWLE